MKPSMREQVFRLEQTHPKAGREPRWLIFRDITFFRKADTSTR